MAWWLGGNPYYGSRSALRPSPTAPATRPRSASGSRGSPGRTLPAEPGLRDRAIRQRRPAERFQRLHGREHPALGLQGRILDPPGHRPGRPVLPRHAPEPARLRRTAAFGNVDSFIGPSSFHPGGANVLLMDGSVRFVKAERQPATWNALGTRAGGEVVSADSL